MNHKEIQESAWKDGDVLEKMREIFKKYQTPYNWKHKFQVIVEDDEIEWLKAAIEWYHGCEAIVIGNTVSSIGYVC